MEINNNLLAFYLILNDCEKNLIWKLTFPLIEQRIRSYILVKVNKENICHHQERINYYHYDEKWLYMKNFTHQTDRYRSYLIIIKASDYNLKRYETIIEHLNRIYVKSSFNEANLFRGYLNLFTHRIDNLRVQFESSRQLNEILIDSCNQLIENNSIKDVIKLFGLKVILIYTAIILKKRIVIYDHRVERLTSLVASLPLFAVHRRNFSSIIFPLLDINHKDDLRQLHKLDHYVAGFSNNHIETRSDLYDLLINTAAVEITINENAKDSFVMTKVHKELALFMKRLVESDDDEIDNRTVIDVIATKTEQLLENLNRPLSSFSSATSSATSSPINTKMYTDPLTPVKLDATGLGLGKNFYKQLAKAEGIRLE